MWPLARRSACQLLAAVVAAPLAAQSAVFDFESLTPFEPSPFCVTQGAITACVRDAVVRPGPQLPEAPGFAGQRIGAYFDPFGGLGPPVITIAFDTPLRSIAFPFQFRPIGGFSPPLAVTLEAFDGATSVGTCVAPSTLVLRRFDGVGPEPERAGEAGSLACYSAPFTSVVITGDPRFGNLWIDDVRVSATPEPGTIALLATGLLLVAAAARARRHSGPRPAPNGSGPRRRSRAVEKARSKKRGRYRVTRDHALPTAQYRRRRTERAVS